MRFSVTVCPGTAPSPVSVLGYSLPSYCPAYSNAAFAPLVFTTSAVTLTPSFLGHNRNDLFFRCRRSFEVGLGQVEGPMPRLDVSRPAGNGNNNDDCYGN